MTSWNLFVFISHSKNELMQWRGVRRRLSVRPSVCKLLRKSLLLAEKWPDRYQTFTRCMHRGCAQGQGQGQRSRDTRTFLDSWNELLRHWRSGLLTVYMYIDMVLLQVRVVRFRDQLRCSSCMSWVMISKDVSDLVSVVQSQKVSRCLHYNNICPLLT